MRSLRQISREEIYTSANLILLGSLKTLERLFQKRHLTKYEQTSFYPLWFVAETERNVFLWRNQLSLSDSDQFEFWIDPLKLISKREQQLLRLKPETPFFGPLWMTGSRTEDTSREELLYLEQLVIDIKEMLPHLHALSFIGSRLEQEKSGGSEELIDIVLPYQPARA